MSFVVTCTCGQQMTVDDAYAGQQVSCISCGGLVTAQPAQPVQPVQPVPPAPIASPAPTPEASPAPATAESSGTEEALPPAPAVPVVQKSGKRRRTFVSDWAKGMAEDWAEEHAEEIASDEKPSTAICVVAGIMTIVIGAYNTLIFGLLLTGALLAKLGGLVKFTEGNLLVVAITILVILSLWTLISGATCIAARRGGASAAVPLNLAWAFLAMFTIFQVKLTVGDHQFWFSFSGVMLFCCLGTVLSLFARRQAGRYQLWLVRKQQEAEGSLVN